MKTIIGSVVAQKNQNTVTVAVTSKWAHPLYKKLVKRTKRYACDTAGSSYAMGDVVTIQECRPISKTKHFKVVGKQTV